MKVIECQDIVTLEDLNGNGWFCMIQDELSESFIDKMKKMSRGDYGGDGISPVERGVVWIYSSLGSALIGKKIGDVVSYNISGVEKRCVVRKILKAIKNYVI